MFRKQHYWIFGGAVLLALILIGLPAKTASRLKLAVSGFFLPLFGLSQSGGQLADQAGNAVVPRSDLLRENEQLRKENQQLGLQLMQTREVWRENEALRQALGWQKESPWNVRLVHVIGRDPANWWRTVHINAGLQHGVKLDAPVLCPDGLVGRVLEAGPTRSQVVLLGDPKCRVSALVPEARDSGVIIPSAAGSWKNHFVELGYLSRKSDLKPGQQVITSGLGGIFPKGIPIGRIADIRSIDGLYVEARVKLAVNLSALEEVWVLTP